MYAALRYFTNTMIVVPDTRRSTCGARPVSLLAEAEVEQMRLGAMDPVAAIAVEPTYDARELYRRLVNLLRDKGF
ncbi:uncharacterized protein ACA1_236520 [Acanthamoeba castellanii str. Neff]|uniref:Uncharacterized protein n=1 Tax=Acanthamoeba castellanii (strain ATCC 30010 / Neff) TaxID=1257118 RepID=L8H0R5_ACACF|nr:uncharacterized protein ACA1_236520 [Acanthamoeba castellanii str. Neff]ELR19074.1 hypothetical protein ACA1_236520 [Acanthamoeba castellanii str. Neff]